MGFFFGNKKLSTEDHARSITLARRLSQMNEADLLQEPYYETSFEKKHFNHDFCKELSSHLVHLRNLPVQCQKYNDVVDDLKKRDVDDTANTADMA